MGGSGCGKSTLLRHMIGLKPTTRGDILYRGSSLPQAPPDGRRRSCEILVCCFKAALYGARSRWPENVALPLEATHDLVTREIAELVSLKLGWVGLRGFENYYPSELSGGMVKRGGLARAWPWIRRFYF